MDDLVIRYSLYMGKPKVQIICKAIHTSFSSKRSISSISRPADFTAAGIATAGPTPITAGSTPTAAKLLKEDVRKQLNATAK
jgi:hypothetical protein